MKTSWEIFLELIPAEAQTWPMDEESEEKLRAYVEKEGPHAMARQVREFLDMGAPRMRRPRPN